jgi:hypothetical protein
MKNIKSFNDINEASQNDIDTIKYLCKKINDTKNTIDMSVMNGRIYIKYNGSMF